MKRNDEVNGILSAARVLYPVQARHTLVLFAERTLYLVLGICVIVGAEAVAEPVVEEEPEVIEEEPIVEEEPEVIEEEARHTLVLFAERTLYLVLGICVIVGVKREVNAKRPKKRKRKRQSSAA